VAFNPVSDALASAHHDGTVSVWDIERMQAGDGNPLIWDITAHTDAVLGVTFSADGRLLASAGGRDQEHNIGVWDAATGKAIRRLHQEQFVFRVAFSPDGRRLACANGRKDALWDLTKGHELPQLSLGDHPFTLRVVFSPDGRWLAMACGDQRVGLWDLATGQEFGTLHVSGGDVLGVAVSPDGRYLATCSGYKGKGTIQLWDASRWEKSPLGSPQ
jgi:WD40 repeat protein